MESIVLKQYKEKDGAAASEIWNQVVEEGLYFPGDRVLSVEEANAYFLEQTDTITAWRGDEMVGLYILHPNNIGRCGHIANASYAVRQGERGQGIGRRLVEDSLLRAKARGFLGLQFNAVVATNTGAMALYESIGFQRLARVPKGYHAKDGGYLDTYIYLYSFCDDQMDNF